MTKRVQSILVGSLLGDGWLTELRKRVETSTYHLKYNDKSLGFLIWIREQVKDLEPSSLKTIEKYSQHYFSTRPREDIGILRKWFYPNEGKKRVPENIEKILSDPLPLAIWYQDDGTLDSRSKYHWNAMFATHCFTYEDCWRLAQTVKKNFGIEMSVCKCQMRGKMYYRLYVLSKSMNRFIETVRPHIHLNFAYKISLD